MWEKKANDSGKSRNRIIRYIAVLAALVLLAVLFKFLLFPPYKQPKVTGDLVVAVEEFTWVDESRRETFTDTGESRALTVKFWYPKEKGSYPLVVFSHGAFGVIDSNYSTCMELASNGYVVASVAHPYHAMFVKDVNGKVTIADMQFVKDIYTQNGTDDPEAEERIYQKSREWMALRTADENFVIDTILEKAKGGEDGPFAVVDREKIGLFGHSMGGASSVALGRIRKDIDAVIDLEGTMFGEYVGFEDGREIYNEAPYPVPLLDVNSRAVYEEALSLSDRQYINFYMGERAEIFKEVIFNDSGHLNFTDLPLVSPILAKMLGVGKVDARVCIENVNQIVLTWFDYYLKGKGEPALKAEY